MKMSNKCFVTITILLATVLLYSCRPTDFTPKPKGYPKIELPTQHTYKQFNDKDFPFTFEYPTYGKITQDTNLIIQENAPYWVNVYFPDWDATIYLSYKTVTPQQRIENLIAESFNLSFKHDKRADYIKTPEYKTDNQLSGVYYHVGGDAASAYQFYATDSAQHFMRGALYFNVTPNADSLLPATEFLHKDLEHLVNTLKFK